MSNYQLQPTGAAGETALFAVAHSVSWSSAAPRHRRATVQRLVEGAQLIPSEAAGYRLDCKGQID